MASTLPIALFLMGTMTSLLHAYEPWPQEYQRNYHPQRTPTLAERFLKRNLYEQPRHRVSDSKDAILDPAKRSSVTVLCTAEQCRELMAFLNRTIPGGYEAVPNF